MRQALRAPFRCAAVVTLLSIAAPSLPEPATEVATVIAGVTVIDGTGAAPRPETTVLIADGRIIALGSADEVPVPPEARVVDGRGRYLIPGLIDMHAHVALGPVRVEVVEGVPAMRIEALPRVADLSLRTLLAYGITTIRDPGGDTDTLVALRDEIAADRRVGPRMRVAGAVIDRTPFEGLTAQITDEASLRAEIRRQAEAGVDMVKLYITLTPDLIGAGVDEAHRHGIPAIAHTLATSWTDAARAGIDGLVHILPGSPELLPAEARAAFAQEMAGTQFMFTWFEHVDLESPEITEMIEALVAHEVTVDPTLVMWETMVRGDDPEVVEGRALRLVEPAMVDNWRTTFNMNPGWQPADFERGRAAFRKALELARRLHEAGVELTAGTDANNPWVVAGPSLHRELEMLVEAGIPPLDVLRIATHNGARVLGLLDEIGTVEVGKRADLVLLGSDPTVSIAATRDIEAVFQRGRVLDRDALLAEVGLEAVALR